MNEEETKMADFTNAEKLKQQQEDLESKLDSISQSDLPSANIIVAGITGTGKSTLINAVFGAELAKTGSGRPVTDHIDEYRNDDIPVHIWDTVGLELNSEKTKQSIQSIKDTIAAKATTEDQFDRVHAIWYCINAGSNRYQGAELNFIKDLYRINVPFIIVLTQCFGAKKKITEFEEQIKTINDQEGMGDISIVRVLAQDFDVEIDDETTVHKAAFGLEDLVDETLRRLPEFIKSGFVAAQRVSKGQKREQCEDIIYYYAKAAHEGFWDNIPLINVFTTNDKIKGMLRKIGLIYNSVLSEQSVNKIISETSVDFSNQFRGLLDIFAYGSYSSKITDLLTSKKEEGFNVKVESIPANSRSARMITLYGYTFIDSIEELWMKLTEKQLSDVDMVVDNLIGIINRKLNERRSRRNTLPTI